jgi:hypothetical protein
MFNERIFMKNFIALMFVAALVLLSCGEKKDGNEPAEKAVSESPKTEAETPAEAAGVDQSKPENVVQAIFDAAKNQSYGNLKNLCDPKGESDTDSKMICELADDKKEEFISYFSKGKITGPAVINGENAEVPILFGPDGAKQETMKLINRDGKWYLLSF